MNDFNMTGQVVKFRWIQTHLDLSVVLKCHKPNHRLSAIVSDQIPKVFGKFHKMLVCSSYDTLAFEPNTKFDIQCVFKIE